MLAAPPNGKGAAMTRSTTPPADLDRLSRFTFAGRGCRDPRRERRRPAAVARPALPALRAPGPSAAAPSDPAASTGTAPASPDSGADTRPSERTTGEFSARPGERPPPPARTAERGADGGGPWGTVPGHDRIRRA